MASCSDSVTKTIRPADAYVLKLAYSGEQDVISNTTTLTIKGTISRKGSVYTAKNLNGSKNTVVIDGKTYHPTTAYNLMDHTSKQIFNYTQTITHDADGSKTIAMSWTFDGNVDNAYNPSGTITLKAVLPVIPRASTITVQDGVYGGNVAIAIQAYSPSFTHRISYELGTRHGTIPLRSSAAVWQIPIEWMADIPNAMSQTGTIRCETCDANGALIGTPVAVPVTIRVPDAIKPSIDNITITEGNALPNEVIGLVQGKSKGMIEITASGIYGSTIQTTEVRLDGELLADPATTGLLEETGNHTVDVTVMDSRGQTASDSLVFAVYGYQLPRIERVSLRRMEPSKEGYVESDSGTIAELNMRSVIAEQPFATTAAAYQTATYMIYYKKETESEWSSQSAVFLPEQTVYLNHMDIESAYDVQIELTDAFGAIARAICRLSSVHVIMDISESGRGIAFGAVSTKEDTIQFGWDIDGSHHVMRDMMLGLPRLAGMDADTDVYAGCVSIREYAADGLHLPNGYDWQIATCGSEDGQSATQMAICLNGDAGLCIRNQQDGKWGAWNRVVFDGDVAAWAKEAVKPTYRWDEIVEKPTSYPPDTHTHDQVYAPYGLRNGGLTLLWEGSSQTPSFAISGPMQYKYFLVQPGTASSTYATFLIAMHLDGYSTSFRGIGGYETESKGVEIYSMRGTMSTTTAKIEELYARSSYDSWGGTKGTKLYVRRVFGVK